jgi:hypothetical protein
LAGTQLPTRIFLLLLQNILDSKQQNVLFFPLFVVNSLYGTIAHESTTDCSESAVYPQADAIHDFDAMTAGMFRKTRK